MRSAPWRSMDFSIHGVHVPFQIDHPRRRFSQGHSGPSNCDPRRTGLLGPAHGGRWGQAWLWHYQTDKEYETNKTVQGEDNPANFCIISAVEKFETQEKELKLWEAIPGK